MNGHVRHFSLKAKLGWYRERVNPSLRNIPFGVEGTVIVTSLHLIIEYLAKRYKTLSLFTNMAKAEFQQQQCHHLVDRKHLFLRTLTSE